MPISCARTCCSRRGISSIGVHARYLFFWSCQLGKIILQSAAVQESVLVVRVIVALDLVKVGAHLVKGRVEQLVHAGQRVDQLLHFLESCFFLFFWLVSNS